MLIWIRIVFGIALLQFTFAIQAATVVGKYTLSAGHESLHEFVLPETPYPQNNKPNSARVELGKMLFFDTRLSGDGNMSCGTCHSPMYGWSDGLPTARGVKSMVLGRATPTITNTAFNDIQMWDGRKKSLEDQALGPMEANVEMNMDLPKLFAWLSANETYATKFARAYKGEEIGAETLAKAIASFERTVVSKDSAFDRWLAGDAKAMSAAQIRGFDVFLDPEKGNCAVCHSGANLTDNGFHNIGLPSFAASEPDMGRYAEKPLKLMKGAFKTPTLRDISLTAPYFHDGSAASLEDAVEHYAQGGVVKTNLSPNLKQITLSAQEKSDLVAFMEALSSEPKPFELPVLPSDPTIVMQRLAPGDAVSAK